MSRSYRKPYASVVGTGSTHLDKKLAARGVRHQQNQWLRTHWQDEDSGPLPHPLGCSLNNIYTWRRDGGQFLQISDNRCWSRYCLEINGLHPYDYPWRRQRTPMLWPPKWYVQLLRK